MVRVNCRNSDRGGFWVGDLCHPDKWWFSLRMIWVFWGPGFRTSWQSSVRRTPTLPNGPFRTKTSTALESVVFCHRRSFSLSVPFSCLLCLKKQAFLSPLRSVLLRAYRIYSPYRNSLSVVFLVREGPLGRHCLDACRSVERKAWRVRTEHLSRTESWT